MPTFVDVGNTPCANATNSTQCGETLLCEFEPEENTCTPNAAYISYYLLNPDGQQLIMHEVAFPCSRS